MGFDHKGPGSKILKIGDRAENSTLLRIYVEAGNKQQDMASQECPFEGPPFWNSTLLCRVTFTARKAAAAGIRWKPPRVRVNVRRHDHHRQLAESATYAFRP